MEHLSTQELVDVELEHARQRIALALEGPPSPPHSSAGPIILLILGVIIGAIAIAAPEPWLGAPVAIAFGAGGWHGLDGARARRRARRAHVRRPGYLEAR